MAALYCAMERARVDNTVQESERRGLHNSSIVKLVCF